MFFFLVSFIVISSMINLKYTHMKEPESLEELKMKRAYIPYVSEMTDVVFKDFI